MRGRKPGSPKVKDLAAGRFHVVDGGGADDAPPPPADDDAPPAWLTDENAIAEWQRVIPELKLRKQYIRLFESEVARYCSAFGYYVAAYQEMAKSGAVVKASTGTDMLSQHWIVMSRAHEMMSKLASDLGLNPVAQCRLAGMQLDLFDDMSRGKTGTDGRGGNPFGGLRR